nr:MAG TPA: hypothetical protein [Caudoviricetes sp.]
MRKIFYNQSISKYLSYSSNISFCIYVIYSAFTYIIRKIFDMSRTICVIFSTFL